MQRAIKWFLSLLGSIAFLCGGFVILHGSLPPASINAWLPAGNLTAARAGAASVLLQDGRLLITGGNGASGALATTEILDPSNGFTAGPPMNFARAHHVAVLLQDGRVLVAGGTDASGAASQSAELFDPAANSWSAAGPLMVGRSGATATLLASGQVLIAGGSANGAALASLELFDPNSNTFTSAAGVLSSARENHAAAPLPDGRVIILGGWDGTTQQSQSGPGGLNVLASTDIFDPTTGAVAPGPAMTSPRMNFTATRALDGSVVAIGGTDGVNDLASIDVLIPGAGAFALSGAQLTTTRQGHLAFLLPHNGNILVVGGTSSGVAVSSAELYTPWTGATSVTGAMASARSGATGSPLFQMVLTAPVGIDGALLVAGGLDASSPPTTLQSAEVYGFATIKTDQTDYPPGVPVTVTGSGWQPGEVVQMSLVEVPDLDGDSPIALTATADANGNIINTSFSTNIEDANIHFTLTAVGAISQAQTTFTDSVSLSKVNTIGPQTPNPVVKGNSATYAVTVTFSGSNGNCTSTLSASGLPTGASASFSNNPYASTGGNQLSTLTVSTNASTTPVGSTTFTITATGSAGCSGSASSGTPGNAANPTLVVVGPASHIRVETAADGSGSVLGPASVASGTSVTGYAIERDASNNFVANVTATWSLVSKTGGVVDGDLVPSGDTKSAVFTGHVIGTAQMQASADTFTGTSGTLTVVPGTAYQLVFGQQPTNTVAGATITPAITVKEEDASGNVLTGDSSTSIAIAILNNPGSGTLSGTTSQKVASGIATFNDLSINNTGNGYTLQATHGGLVSATSNSFNITSATPLTVTINQASGQADPTNASPINFTVVFSASVSDFATGDVSFTGSTASGTLGGTVTGSGTTYNVAVSGMTGDGTVVASIPAGVAHDASNNANQASTSTDNTVTYDTTKPVITKSIPGTPQYSSGGNTYVTSATTIRVNIAESGSGLDTCTISISGPASTSFSCTTGNNDFTLGGKLTSPSDGSYTISVTAKDLAGNTGSDPLTVILDNTGPSLSETLGNPSYDNGTSVFVKSTTTISVGATDSGSGVATCTLSGAASGNGAYTPGNNFTLPAGDGSKSYTVECKDNLQNPTTLTNTRIVDDTGPTASVSYLSGTTYTSGGVTYVNASTLFQGACVSDGSGSGCDPAPSLAIDPGTGSFGAFGSTTNFSASGADGVKTLRVEAKDRLGNIGSAATLVVTLDTTPPVITITTPGDGTNYLLNQAVAANYSCTDALSGAATCTGTVANGSNIDTSSVGQHSFTVNSIDNVGNSSSKTVHYDVVFNFIGFLPPIANLPVMNGANAGQTIPIKWQLTDANGNYISDLGTLTGMKLIPIACSSGYVISITDDTVDATGGTVFRYDTTSNQFIYNWGTVKAFKGGCLEVQVTLSDGTNHLAGFQFK